jgi:HNH endonuclease
MNVVRGAVIPNYSNAYWSISMDIYRSTPRRTKTNYRKIYEQYYGSIPKEPNGRSYEIHHVDGNDENNDPSNLICVSIKEHYDIHYSQKDWKACLALAMRMKISPDEKIKLCKLANDGENNPSFGKYWWTNGCDEIKQTERPYEDWYRGRSPIKKIEMARNRVGKATGFKNSKSDKTIYHFIHSSGIEAKMTRIEFRNEFSLTRKGVENLLNGGWLSHRGWRMFTPIREPKPLGRPKSPS